MDRWTRALWAVQSAAGVLSKPPLETREHREQRELADAKVRHQEMLAGWRRGPTSPPGHASPAQQAAEAPISRRQARAARLVAVQRQAAAATRRR